MKRDFPYRNSNKIAEMLYLAEFNQVTVAKALCCDTRTLKKLMRDTRKMTIEQIAEISAMLQVPFTEILLLAIGKMRKVDIPKNWFD